MTEAPTSMGFENEISPSDKFKKESNWNREKIQPNTAASCGRELLKSIAQRIKKDLILWSQSIEHRAENVCEQLG
jgi:hypothetical protein